MWRWIGDVRVRPEVDIQWWIEGRLERYKISMGMRFFFKGLGEVGLAEMSGLVGTSR